MSQKVEKVQKGGGGEDPQWKKQSPQLKMWTFWQILKGKHKIKIKNYIYTINYIKQQIYES